MRRTRRVVLVAALAASVVFTAQGSGAGSPSTSDSWPPDGAGPAHAASAGLSSQLAQVAAAARSGAPAALGVARAQDLAVAGTAVRVVIEPADGVKAAEDAVAAAGGRVEASAGGLVQALVPPTALAPLGGAAAIAAVRAPATPFAQAVDEGVTATDASLWHAAGYNGAGVKVAVIDLGFLGYQSLLGTALPASVTTINRCGGASTSSSVSVISDHGTAVAELVHQMAPGAQLYLICVDTEVDLELAEQDAIAAGVRIVNHSVGWLNTGRGDGSGAAGSPDATVADARAHGILWVNAAGNYGAQHWSGTFESDSQNEDLSDFVGGDDLDRVTVQAGAQVCAFLKWDSWPVTSEDFDLYLVRVSDNTIVDASVNDQSSGPDAPTEELCYTNPGPTQNYGVGIVRYNAVTTPRFDLFVVGGSNLQYGNAAGSVVEPASSPAALAVGADCWQTGATEPFSSQGPTIDGRIKPDLAAPDGVSTATYGNSGATCGQSGFLGTSASTPQVAGAAAILLGRDPSLTAAGLEAALEQTSFSSDVARLAPDDAVGSGRLRLGRTAPSAGTILFSQPGTGLFTVDDDGQSLVKIPGANTFGSPSWSQDGSRIAFLGGSGSMWVEDANGGNAVGILSGNGPGTKLDPAWAPDGSKIAFGQSGVGMITVDPDGQNAKTIHPNTSGDSDPTWSPDSKKIAFVALTGTSSSDVWVMNGDGTSPLKLTSSGDVIGGDAGGRPAEHSLAWSPDGTKIAYIRSGSSIWTMNADGTNQRLVYTPPAGTAVLSLAWSPDGTRILFNDIAGGALWTVKTDGTSPVKVLQEPNSSATDGPVWRSGIPATENMVAPILSGSPVVGESLVAASGAWSPIAGEALSFAWSRCNAAGASCSLTGVADGIYPVTAADLGSTLQVTVTASGTNGSAVTRALSAVVTAARPTASTLPRIDGPTTVGSTLTMTSAGTWSGSPAFSLRWGRCDNLGGACSAIPGATAGTYTLTSVDAGHQLRLVVTGTNGGGSTVASSLPSAAITSGGGGGGGGGPGGGGGAGSSSSATTTVTTTPTISTPSAPPPAPPTPLVPPGTKPVTPSFASLTVAALKPVLLHMKRPSLRVTVKATKATSLTIVLVDSTGKIVARWSKRKGTGTSTFVLLLPAKARHKGHDSLKLTATGNPTAKLLPVLLKA
jgi:hypothetical protein